MAYSGKYKLINPGKYEGDPTNIVWRSRWEALLMRYLDMHPHVTKWSSEEIVIPYISPIDGRYHRYFVDFKASMQSKDGTIKTLLIEVKPYEQTHEPDISKYKTYKNGKPTLRFVKAVQTWGVNDAKWKAAREYCADRGWHFIIMTEYELGLKKRK